MSTELLSAIVAVVGTAMVITGLISGIERFRRVKEAPTLEQRIQTLTESLRTSAQTITDIEQEIQKRQELVGRLKQDAETASKLSAVNREQVEAIAQVLRTQIREEEHSTFWTNQGLGILYALMGAIVGAAIPWLIERWRKKADVKEVSQND